MIFGKSLSALSIIHALYYVLCDLRHGDSVSGQHASFLCNHKIRVTGSIAETSVRSASMAEALQIAGETLQASEKAPPTDAEYLQWQRPLSRVTTAQCRQDITFLLNCELTDRLCAKLMAADPRKEKDEAYAEACRVLAPMLQEQYYRTEHRYGVRHEMSDAEAEALRAQVSVQQRIDTVKRTTSVGLLSFIGLSFVVGSAAMVGAMMPHASSKPLPSSMVQPDARMTKQRLPPRDERPRRTSEEWHGIVEILKLQK